jgi:hypothetical protein
MKSVNACKLLILACLIAHLASSTPVRAQVTVQEIATRERVFTAPGLGRAVSTYETRVIAGGEEAVHVFELGSPGWTHTATLTASDGKPGDEFGAAVALSDIFAVIGAPGAEVDGYSGAGAAYVFMALPDGSWVQRARLVSGSPSTGAHFGAAVAASAEVSFAIGSPGAGRATVFEPDNPGFTWRISAELTAPDLTPDEAVAAGFGAAADITVDFDIDFVAVGAPGADGSGAVYAYRRAGSTWNFDNKLVDSPRAAAGRFGQAVSIQSTSFLIGAPGARRVVGVLVDPDSGKYTPLGVDLAGPDFGLAVGIGGARVIAGDPAHRVAYMYGRGVDGGVLTGTLAPAAGAPGDDFGASVDMNAAAVVGAPGADAIHIFDLGTSATFDHLAITVGGKLSYIASGDLYGQFEVTRNGDRVVAITGRGRLLSGTVPSPFVAFELHQLGKGSRMAGTITISEPATGFEHLLDITTSAQAVSATAVTGRGNGFDVQQQRRRHVTVDWSIDDLMTGSTSTVGGERRIQAVVCAAKNRQCPRPRFHP